MLGLVGYGRLGHKIVNNLRETNSLIIGVRSSSKFDNPNLSFTLELSNLTENCSDIILSLKKSSLKDLSPIKSYSGNIISTMANVEHSELYHYFPNSRVIRIMPNIYLDNITFLSRTSDDEKIVKRIFPHAKLTPVKTCNQFEITTIVNGCGPALFSWMYRELYNYGSRETDPEYIKRLLLDVIENTHLHLHLEDPQNIINDVSSPGGLTEELIARLDKSKFLD